MTTAVLKALGTHPSMSEMLTSFVSDGNSMSMHSLIRNVGQGSNSHNFVGEVLIILSTASSESCLKTKIIANFRNFVQKKEANWSANDFSDSWDGSESRKSCLNQRD